MTLMPRFDHMQEQAIKLGERNAAAIELVRKHCANARVERHPMGGIGLLEQMTGLPIEVKTVTCEYAAKPPNFAGAEFLPVALSFYMNNCVGCPQRILVGIPNLTMVANDIDEREHAEAERRERAEQQARAERDARHRGLERRVMNEPPTRDLVRLVSLLDAEDRPSGPGDELVATVKAAPQYVTPQASEVLLEAAESGMSEHILGLCGSPRRRAASLPRKPCGCRPQPSWTTRAWRPPGHCCASGLASRRSCSLRSTAG